MLFAPETDVSQKIQVDICARQAPPSSVRVFPFVLSIIRLRQCVPIRMTLAQGPYR
jgi:hypothetical protein